LTRLLDTTIITATGKPSAFALAAQELLRMKAEERKELEHNALSTWLNKSKEKLATGSGTTTLVVIGLILAVFFGYRFFANLSASNRSSLWYALDTATTDDALDVIIAENGDSLQGQLAQLYDARIYLGPQGLEALATPDKEQREKAITNIEKARDVYVKLAPGFGKYPVLQSEAYLSAGKAEESLIGIPKADSAEDRGNIDRVRELYEKAAAIFPDQELNKAAGKRAKEIVDDKDAVLAFYRKLNTEVLTRKVPAPTPRPQFPGGGFPGGGFPGGGFPGGGLPPGLPPGIFPGS